MSVMSILQNNTELDDEQINKLNIFAEMLKEKNRHVNLTAITEDGDIAVKHFLDSLSVFTAVNIDNNSKIIDVGTGAGFPAIPMIIADPTLKITMLDSLNKRIVFIEEVLQALSLKAEAIHGRAEDIGKQEQYRETYDFAISRAVASLNVLAELCLPFVKPGGYFIAMKGPDADNEIQEGLNALSALRSEVTDVKRIILPDGITRNIVLIKKLEHTDIKYPRTAKQISKKPL